VKSSLRVPIESNVPREPVGLTLSDRDDVTKTPVGRSAKMVDRSLWLPIDKIVAMHARVGRRALLPLS